MYSWWPVGECFCGCRNCLGASSLRGALRRQSGVVFERLVGRARIIASMRTRKKKKEKNMVLTSLGFFAKVEVSSREAMKVLGLSGWDNPTLRVIALLLLENLVKGAVALLDAVVGWQQDIQHGGSVGTGRELVEISFVGVQHGHGGSDQPFHTVATTSLSPIRCSGLSIAIVDRPTHSQKTKQRGPLLRRRRRRRFSFKIQGKPLDAPVQNP